MTKLVHWLWLGLFLIGCGADTEVGEPLRIVARDLPEAYLGESYRGQVSFSGGVRPYEVSLEGRLPEGIRHSQGIFSGTPQEKGEFPLRLTVEDAGLSVRTEDLILEVVDPPLPKLEAKVEGEEEPVLVLSLLERETPGFRARLELGQAQIDPGKIDLSERVFAVTRYDPEQDVLDIDGVLSQPGKGLEVLRVPLVPKPQDPAKKDSPSEPQSPDAPLAPQGSDAPLASQGSDAPQNSPDSAQPTRIPDAEEAKPAAPAPPFRPNIQVQAQFLRDRNQFFPGEVPPRPQVEGEYDFADLVTLASNWGEERPQASPPDQSANPENEKDETDAVSEEPPTESEKVSNETLPASENGAEAALPASENGADKTAPPALASENTATPAPLAGDLDRDGKVGEADLEKLRSSYSWQAGEIRGQPGSPAPQTPAGEPNQAPPDQDPAPEPEPTQGSEP